MIYHLKRSVGLWWLFDHQCYIHLRWYCLFIQIELRNKIGIWPDDYNNTWGGGVPRNPLKWLRNLCTTPKAFFSWYMYNRVKLKWPSFEYLNTCCKPVTLLKWLYSLLPLHLLLHHTIRSSLYHHHHPHHHHYHHHHVIKFCMGPCLSYRHHFRTFQVFRIIPDICHERHEYIRVNFFWPV